MEEKKMRKRIIAFVSIIMCAMMFAGCKNTLEKKISKKQLQDMNDQAYEQYVKNDPSMKDIKIEIKDNDLTYKYYFNMEFDDSQIAAMKKSIDTDANKKMIENLKKTIKKENGIEPSSITYIYYDKNDEEIARVSA